MVLPLKFYGNLNLILTIPLARRADLAPFDFITTYANRITFDNKLQVAKPGDLILCLNLSTRVWLDVVDSDPYLWTLRMLC